MPSRLLAVLLLHSVIALAAHAAEPLLHVVMGVDAAGRATQPWLEMIAARLPEADFHQIESLAKPYTPAETAWVNLIHSRLPEWERAIPALAHPFRPVAAPEAGIVLGNRGGEDAFGDAANFPHTICFDVERLNALYGDAHSSANAALIDRLFRHEYTHLLQRAWLNQQRAGADPLPAGTPLEAALAAIWREGLGNYYSLSGTWKSVDSKPSARAAATLRVLEPRFLARLAALACAAPENAPALTRNLSSGPFDRKWGALPVALWLDAERSNPDSVRNFIQSGEDGVWTLANRHLPPGLQPQLEEIRTLAKTCAASDKPTQVGWWHGKQADVPRASDTL